MMASAAGVASSINTSSSAAPGPGISQKDGNSRAVKPNSASKMTQKGRKESPSDSTRQNTAPKAWSGSNPVTQRSSTPNQGKGTVQNKSQPTSKMTSAKDGLSDKHSYDRLRFVLGGAIGLQVILVTKAGDKYEGVFAGYLDSASKLTLKMTKKVINNPITQPNGISSWEAAFAGSSPDYAVTFDVKDMADMTIPEFSLPEATRQPNGASASFQTDMDISGNASRGERVLQRWVPDTSDPSDFSLEAGGATGWDQFATHARMTGGQSTYTEETYTTSIDRHAPDYKRREAEAARIAREIETQPSANVHIREERGQMLENDFDDEEEKYSGVRRDQPRDFFPLPTGSTNRYTPPALRAPSGKPSTSGTPVDPAIISSQIARSDLPRSGFLQQPALARPDSTSNEKAGSQARAASMMQPKNDGPASPEKNVDLLKLAANGSTSKTLHAKQMPSQSPERHQDSEPPSQGVETKLLGSFKQFAQAERARLAEKKRLQASQDRTAKINDLLRFAKNFKLKTPIPDDLVGILAKDPKKQEALMEKSQRDHEEAKTVATPSHSSSSSTAQLPPVPKFDKSQIPPPIPPRETLNAGRGAYAKSTAGRGGKFLPQQLPFAGAGVPLAPRGPGYKNGQLPTPIPLPDIKGQQSTSGNSGVSSPRGTDTPTSAVSTKFNVRALEFRPTTNWNPSNASVSAASPSPIKRTASIVRTASPSTFFGQRKPKKASQRLDIMANFDPLKRMKEEVKTKLAENSEDKRDYAFNGGIPNAYHTNPTWLVSDENKEKTYEEFFGRSTASASPVQSRTSSSHTIPFHGQMQHMVGPHMPQAVTPQHGHHSGPHYQPHFEDQRMHMQNGSPSMFASPNMTPRGTYVSPMGHPAQASYGHQSYFGGVNGPMHMRQYGNNAAMMHGQHANMVAPMMAQQQSSGGYMGMPNQMGMVFPSPRPTHVFPQQQNGYPSPGPMAPVMMHQNSQHGYHGNPQMMYGNAAGMYGPQPQIGRGYGGNHTPYGTSPHQPHHMGQRAMSHGYMQKGMPQMSNSGGAPANAPQQPAAFGQMQMSDEAK